MRPTRLGGGRLLAPAGIAVRLPRPSPGMRVAAAAVLLVTTALLLVAQPATSDADEHRQEGSWSDAGELHVQRGGGHTATRLDDGGVLLVGGGDVAASAEVWDPTPRSSQLVAAPKTGRVGHTATRLDDGRVLVAGGDPDGAASASAEVYDPDEGAWQTAEPMGQPRRGHTATRLDDGRVLVVGGADPDGRPVAAAEVYDPDQDVWQPAGSMSAGRVAHTATRLDGGRVLVAGGEDAAGDPQPSAERFDPDAAGEQAWQAAGEMAAARAGHAATRLADGRVLVVGGTAGGEAASVEIADADGGGWVACSPAEDTPGCVDGELQQPSASRLGDDTLLLVGETADGVGARRYDPEAGVWWPAAAPQGRYDEPTTTRLDGGQVLLATEAGFGDVAGDGEVYSPTTVPAPRVAGIEPAAGSVAGGEEVVLSGEHLDGAVFARFGEQRTSELTVDSDQRVRVTTPTAPPGEVAVRLTTPGGTSEVTEPGRFVFDGGEGAWESAGEMGEARAAAATELLDGPACASSDPPDYCGQVLVVGGDFAGGTSERYDPDDDVFDAAASLPAEFGGNHRGVETVALGGPECRTGEAAGHCGAVLALAGDGTVARYDPPANAWELGDPVPFEASGLGVWAVLLDGSDCDQPAEAAPAHCGSVLVVGSGQSPSAARYDPSADEWAEAASPAEPRSSYVMTLIDGDVCDAADPPPACGQVLKASGVEIVPGVARRMTTAELYDPVADAWRSTATDPPAGRRRPAMARLSDGRVVIAGGHLGAKGPTAEAEVFDPDGETWQPLPPMPEAREGHAATAMADGRVLIVGGAGQPPRDRGGVQREVLDSAVVGDPDTGQWTYAASMTEPRAGGARGSPLPAFALQPLADGQVLAAGGHPAHQTQPADATDSAATTPGEPTASAELYTPQAGAEPTTDQAGATDADGGSWRGLAVWIAGAVAAAAAITVAVVIRRRHRPTTPTP